MVNDELQKRFLKGKTVLAISVKEDSSRLWQTHRVYAFPFIQKSYPYIANIMKDMYISFMHQGYIDRLYKLDNPYVMKPFDILEGNIFSHERHKDSIYDYVKDRMKTKFRFDDNDKDQEYMFFTFYPEDRDIELSHQPRYLVNGKVHQGYCYFAMGDLLDIEFPDIVPESKSSERLLQRSKVTDTYQDAVEQLLTKEQGTFVPNDTREPLPSLATMVSQSFRRDANRGRNALLYADFSCEFEPSHHDFISATTNRNYVEGHHLIPIQFQREFSVSIDVEANIVSLCVTCHKKLHHGRFEDKMKILKKLYEDRNERLKKCGVDIKLQQLYEYYL